jgi:ankyrin repeat protein
MHRVGRFATAVLVAPLFLPACAKRTFHPMAMTETPLASISEPPPPAPPISELSLPLFAADDPEIALRQDKVLYYWRAIKRSMEERDRARSQLRSGFSLAPITAEDRAMASILDGTFDGPDPPAISRPLSNQDFEDSIRRGDFEALYRIPPNVDVEKRYGYERATALHWAAYVENINAMKMLIQRGADVNAKTLVGRTPLHWAAHQGREYAAMLLLEKGADLNARDKLHKAPLDVAREMNHVEVTELFTSQLRSVREKDAQEMTRLHWAALHGHKAEIEMILMLGADVNALDNQGRTPLHAAVCANSKDAVRALLEKRADAGAKDPYGLTPLFEAKSWLVVKMLIAKGAKVADRDKTGQTPLHWAAAYGLRDVAQELIDNGADVKARDKFGRTPGDVAREEKQLEVAGMLGK